MSQRSNVIDLTVDSDEESRSHDNNGARSRPKSNTSPLRSKPTSQPYQGVSYASRQSTNPYQPYAPAQSHRPDIFARRNVNPSQSFMSNREVERSSLPSQRPIAPVVPGKAKVLRRACVNCTEVKVTCDGECPCSACVEPGLPCYYPGEIPPTREMHFRGVSSKPSAVAVTKLISHPGSKTESATSSSRPSPALQHLTKQTDLLPNSLINVSSPKHTSRFTPQREPFLDSDDSDDEDIPLAIAEIEEVKKLLRKHETKMRDHRAYLLQPLLNQAKIEGSKATGPKHAKPWRNPFENIISGHRHPTTNSTSKTSVLQLQMKSNRNGALKKWTQVSVPLKVVSTDPTILPKYKSIGRLGTSLLAPNIRTLKYWPYFPDEEKMDPSEAKKNEELEERYQHDDNHLLAQRKCSELVDMWRPWVEDFVSKLRIEFSDILYWFLHTTDKTSCDTCERDILADTFRDVSRLMTKPNDRALMLSRLATIALKDVAEISMWHFVLGVPSVKDLMRQVEPAKEATVTLCSICFLHNCLTHGAYQEPEESGGAVIMGGNIEINDEELNHNIRHSAAIPNDAHVDEHQCSLYCVAAEVRVKDILGRRKDGTIAGLHNRGIHVPRPNFKNEVTCSDNCFWPVEKRTRFSTVLQTKDYCAKISDKSKNLLRQFLRIYSDNQRVPCMLAREIEDLECIDAFYWILGETQRVSHYRQAMVNSTQQGMRKISKIAAGLDTSLSADLDERPPFVPCSHPGPCLNNPECTCAQNKIHCEWFCGCDKTCDRRFPGCKCANANKTCFNDKNCECWKHNRECDPWLCGHCGVHEVLDPQNKYNDEIRRGRCKNNRIQLELPARTIKAPSEVQGWGLYAGVDLEENTFIGEYKGETVGNQESDRRGAVYANIGQEYLFVMNRDQQIDGSNFGNKTRFINNSQRDDYINVFAKKLLCNGVQRVMLYTKKNIPAGEELLYNYNYPISVTKKFWERGEGPTNVPGAVVAKPSISWIQPRVNGRFAKVAGNQEGDHTESPAENVSIRGGYSMLDVSTTKRDVKRKRASEGDLVLEAAEATNTDRRNGSKEAFGDKGGIQIVDDPEDSDFELIEVTESSGSMDEAEGGSDEGDGSTTGRRRRAVYANDRRRGGLAQAKAWETRRKRNGKGK